MSALIFLAFLAFGFFAATLLPLFWVLAITASAAVAAGVIAVAQGAGPSAALGLGVGGFAVSQVGYGLGLAWVARTRRDQVPD